MLNPEEIENTKLRRSVFGGYRRENTRELLGQIASELRQLLHERDTLEEELRPLRAELLRRERRDEVEIAAFKSIQQSAHEVRESARRDAELLLRKAYKQASEARGIIDKEYTARVAEFQTLEEKSKVLRNELRTMLTSVLGALEDEPLAAAAPRPKPSEQPRRTQAPVTQDLERAVRELVGRIQRKPGVPAELPRTEISEPTAEDPAVTAEDRDDSSGERVA
jgi:cell division initiation protein